MSLYTLSLTKNVDSKYSASISKGYSVSWEITPEVLRQPEKLSSMVDYFINELDKPQE